MKQLPIYILIIVFVLFSLRPPKPSEVVTSTTYDTIVFHDTINNLKVDTIYNTIHDTIINNIPYTLKKFEYSVEDSLLNASIIITSPFKPLLDFKYSVNTINRIDTLKTDLKGFYYGGTYNPIINEIALTGGYMNPKGNLFTLSLGYKVVRVGYLQRF